MRKGFATFSSHERGFAQSLLIIVVLVIVVASGAYFYQSSKVSQQQIVAKVVNKPIQSFRPENYTAKVSKQPEVSIYKNTSLGFEFTHAKDIIVKDDSEEEYNKRGNGNFRKNFIGYVGYEPGQALGAVVALDKSGSYDTNPFSVWVFTNDNKLSVEGWFDRYWYYPFLWGVFDWTSKSHITLNQEATVSGQLAKYQIVSYQPGKPKYMYTYKDRKMYLFRIIGDTGEQILANFKFN